VRLQIFLISRSARKGHLREVDNRLPLLVLCGFPWETEREYINSVIFDELCAGKMNNESRERFVQIINRLVDEDGVQAVILGCTEIPLLIKQRDVKVPVFDTMTIHAEAAVKYALSGT
jgi:aspartate racemase